MCYEDSLSQGSYPIAGANTGGGRDLRGGWRCPIEQDLMGLSPARSQRMDSRGPTALRHRAFPQLRPTHFSGQPVPACCALLALGCHRMCQAGCLFLVLILSHSRTSVLLTHDVLHPPQPTFRHLSRAAHAPLPNSVAEVISHVRSRAAQRGWVPWSLRLPVAQQMACLVCLEGVQAKVEEPELRDEERSRGSCCAVPGELQALTPFPLLLVRTWPLILIRLGEEAGSARDVLRGVGQALLWEP